MLKKINIDAKYIWCEDNARKNDFVVFKKSFNLDIIPENAIAYVSVDTRYWLKINNKSVVREGGLYRESIPGSGYADEIDITPYLEKGKNEIEILAHFYGCGGRCNVNSGAAGLIFSCEAIGVKSDKSFLCTRHPAYYTPEDDKSSYLHGGANVGYDNTKSVADFKPAVEYENIWGDTYLRPIPLFRYNKPKKYNEKLPYGMWYVVSFEIFGKEGEKIRVYSDRYAVNGGPGDENNVYYGYFHEFILKDGLNKLSTIYPVFGEEIRFSKEVQNVRYTETGYDCDIIGIKKFGDKILDNLVKKSARTLYACMRDNFMDCPDREHGQWIGDVSVQVPQVFYLLSDNAVLLVKKAIYDFINNRKGDILVGNVPGENFSELPSQSLNAISELGMISSYVKQSGDVGILKDCFDAMVKYLMLFEMDSDGLVIPRKGNWAWVDHLYNIDERVMVNCWYYSALKFSLYAAEMTGNNLYNSFLAERKEFIEKNFEKSLWKKGYYASGAVVDDRANALAVLSGLCPKEKYPAVRKILISVFNASVYMENYVLTALCEMGYKEDAKKRMLSRYYNLAVNENSTLWEDFFILGTKNHAWSGAPVNILYRYFIEEGVEKN